MNKTKCQPHFFVEPFESYEKNKMHQNGNALTLPVAALAGQAVRVGSYSKKSMDFENP